MSLGFGILELGNFVELAEEVAAGRSDDMVITIPSFHSLEGEVDLSAEY